MTFIRKSVPAGDGWCSYTAMNRKTQNMHAGLRPGDLKRRYLRALEEGLESDKAPARLGQEDTSETFQILPDEAHPDDKEYGSLDEYMPYELVRTLLLSANLGDLPALREIAGGEPTVSKAEFTRCSESDDLAYPNDLVDKLFVHLKLVVSDPSDSFRHLGIQKRDLIAIGDLASKHALAQARASETVFPGEPAPTWISRLSDLSAWDHSHLQSLICVLLFYPFRLREIECWHPTVELSFDWDVPELVGDLARHLYGNYPVPVFMSKTFNELSLVSDRERFLPSVAQMVLYILFARGVRLSRVNSVGWLKINPAMVRHLFSVPEQIFFKMDWYGRA